MEELVKVLTKMAIDEVDENGVYFEDSILFDSIEPITIDKDVYKVNFYDETELIFCEECWNMFLQVFEVFKNGEKIGYVGRECRISCCGGDTQNFDFEILKPVKIETTYWERPNKKEIF